MRGLIVFAFAALSISGSAMAGSSCGPWVSQTNGTEWRICVDDQGRQFCQLRDGSEIRPMRCP